MKTNAERQAEYRKRRPFAGEKGNGERRLNTWISTESSLALERLSFRYGVTSRKLLENLILAEQEKVTQTLELDSTEWADYYEKRQVKASVTA